MLVTQEKMEQMKAQSEVQRKAVLAASGGSPASFDAGVWFQSACSGLWYEVKNAAGDISAVRIDGVTYKRQENSSQRAKGNIE